MRGKCNCGKKATGEWLIRNKRAAWSIKWCEDCKPKRNIKEIELIDGK